MWFVYTLEFYSAIKKDKIMSFSGKWMELEIIILNDDKHHVFSYLWKLGGEK
jgi:hypothetical protein